MKKLAAVFALTAIAGTAGADLLMSTTTGSYTQNFDSLISSGSGTWSDNSTIDGWYAQRGNGATTITASTGTSTTGDLYSFGAASDPDRALGSVGSNSSQDFSWGVEFQNTSGFTITSLSISYIGEQWRMNSVGVVQSITFGYQISGSTISDMTPVSDSNWTMVSALDFASPETTGSARALDGNASANRIAISANIDLTLAPNEYVVLRWRDINHSGSDHALATDDVIVNWTAVPEPSSIGMLGLAGFGFLLRRFRRVA